MEGTGQAVIDTSLRERTGCKRSCGGFSVFAYVTGQVSMGSSASWKPCAIVFLGQFGTLWTSCPKPWMKHTSRSCLVLKSRNETLPTASSNVWQWLSVPLRVDELAEVIALRFDPDTLPNTAYIGAPRIHTKLC